MAAILSRGDELSDRCMNQVGICMGKQSSNYKCRIQLTEWSPSSLPAISALSKQRGVAAHAAEGLRVCSSNVQQLGGTTSQSGFRYVLCIHRPLTVRWVYIVLTPAIALFCGQCPLTHWGRVRHIRVSKLTIIDTDNGLASSACQAIIWTNARILLITPRNKLQWNLKSKFINFHSRKKGIWKCRLENSGHFAQAQCVTCVSDGFAPAVMQAIT